MTENDEKYLTSLEAATRLGITVNHLYKLEKRGFISAVRVLPPSPSIKWKVPLKFKESDVEALLKKSRNARLAVA